MGALLKNGVIGSLEEVLEMKPVEAGLTNYPYIVVTSKTQIFCKHAQRKTKGIAVAQEVDGRLETEARAIQLMRRLVGDATYLPEVLFYDSVFCVLALKVAPEGARLLSDDLLQGKVEPKISRRVGQILAQMHSVSFGNDDARRELSSTDVLEKIRFPITYHNISHIPEIQLCADALADELLLTKMCIVHCDYKPNNIFVCPRGDVLVIDFEFAHFGDPAFDCGFLIGMYVHFALVHPNRCGAYISAIEDFWRAYSEITKVPHLAELERRSLRHAGASTLARLDGALKFPSSQHESARSILRPLGQRMILGEFSTVQDIRAYFHSIENDLN